MVSSVKVNCSTGSPAASTVTARSSMPLACRRRGGSRSADCRAAEHDRLAFVARDARFRPADVVVARERGDAFGKSAGKSRSVRRSTFTRQAGQVAAHRVAVRTISRGTPSITSSRSSVDGSGARDARGLAARAVLVDESAGVGKLLRRVVDLAQPGESPGTGPRPPWRRGRALPEVRDEAYFRSADCARPRCGCAMPWRDARRESLVREKVVVGGVGERNHDRRLRRFGLHLRDRDRSGRGANAIQPTSATAATRGRRQREPLARFPCRTRGARTVGSLASARRSAR